MQGTQTQERPKQFKSPSPLATAQEASAIATCPQCGKVIYLRKEEIIQVRVMPGGVEAVMSAWFGCVPCDRIMLVDSLVAFTGDEDPGHVQEATA